MTKLRFLVRAALATFVLAALGYSAFGQEIEDLGTEPFILKIEDQLKIAFPGAPELTTDLQVRRDGVASMPLIGEVRVAGKTPRQLEVELAELYKDQLVSNEVRVIVLQSFFTYYIEGEIARPGIIQSFRELSILDAIVSAGGINKNTGKLNSVIVLRRTGDQYERFELSLKDVLEGKNKQAFMLKPYDVISIPQRVW